jgi:hypothetical protein
VLPPLEVLEVVPPPLDELEVVDVPPPLDELEVVDVLDEVELVDVVDVVDVVDDEPWAPVDVPLGPAAPAPPSPPALEAAGGMTLLPQAAATIAADMQMKKTGYLRRMRSPAWCDRPSSAK